MSLGGMDYADPKKKNNFVGKIIMVSTMVALCILMLKQSPSFNTPSQFSSHEPGVTHVLVTGGAGYIGSHAALCLLKDSYRVTIVDNLSRGNLGAVKVLQNLFPEPGRLQFIYVDLGDAKVDIFNGCNLIHEQILRDNCKMTPGFWKIIENPMEFFPLHKSSGLSSNEETAQECVLTGVGLLAGSSILLLTLIWGTCVILGTQNFSSHLNSTLSKNKNYNSLERLLLSLWPGI
ncbi:hypothetical protein CASFOL_037963 [Castilleja foliolosa]|uniref:NAD(P)-binding domain-containing protein n=1 Tax=Castilleja foliolosa TaxID=1961234 RepID=A0ABD3BLL6_9LAMI